MLRALRHAVPVVFAGFLIACGGGGDGGSADAPVDKSPPTGPTNGGGGTQSGLDARPSNSTCVATTQPTSAASVDDTRVFPNLSFSSPVLLIQVPGDNTKWYVVEKTGTVKVFDNVNTTATANTYIDLTGGVNDVGEGGLLGMAFDPNFATNRRVYLSYTADPTVGGAVLESRISRFTESGGVLNPASEEILLTIAQPFTNHKGGNLAFGPDGLLYAGFGDGGSGGDPDNNSQNRSKLLGKMLRIDVSGNGAYTIPATNPYSGAGTARCQAGTASAGTLCQEIYAYGFRNPWRWSFDRASATPDLWIGDVGQNAFEEVDRVQSGGGNYGWHIREAAHCFNPSSGCGTTADGAPLIDPIAEYDRSVGTSITGGYVYRGTAISSLVGRYIFGDFGNGRVFALLPGGDGALTRTELLTTGANISSFAQGNDGELYYLDFSAGSIFKLVPGAGGGGSSPIKPLLSQTGCMSATDITQPASGLIPYAPAASFWSDGATKTRWMALPDGARITIESDGDWTFPNGTVLVKNFALNGNLIETRLFMRHTDTGNWGGYTYRWNSGHTEANLVSGGSIDTIGGQSWTYPSESQCLQCHTNAAGGSLSLETRQLNTTFHYPSTNRDANQLTTLQAIGLFANALTMQPAYPDPFDAGLPVAERARAYLHINCSQCHRPNGGTPVSMDLRFATAIASTNTCNVNPAAGDLGVAGSRIILPGNAASSVLYLRMSRRDATQMPPLATHQVDTQGAALLQTWINGMTASCQ